MKYVQIDRFGPPEVLHIHEAPLEDPGPGEVRVRHTSIGMNHADLMCREGNYRVLSGDPPFVPGIEAGGYIEAVGPGVKDRATGQRVLLGANTPRKFRLNHGGLNGVYRTHCTVPSTDTVPAPDAIPDDQLGAIWLPYLTAWGCLIWKQSLKPGEFVGIPAASSSVALAAAQIVKQCGALPIGLTTHQSKLEILRDMPEAPYEHVIVTRDEEGANRPWHREIKNITNGGGINVFFDPVAAGDFLHTEIRALAQHGAIWIYGLLQEPGVVDVTPLIMKHGSIRGWVLYELVQAGTEVLNRAYRDILEGFDKGIYQQRVAKCFSLDEVREAHEYMEKGQHIGKLVITPEKL